MKNLSLELYSHGDLDDFKQYITENFNEKYIMADPNYLDWQYGGQLYIAKVAGQGIVGHFGFKNLNYKIGKESVLVRVLMNFFVPESYRDAGVGALLAQKVFNTSSPVLVSGYTKPAERLFDRLKPLFNGLGNLSRYLIVLNPDHFLFKDWGVLNGFPRKKYSGNIDIDSYIDKSVVPLDELWSRVRSRYPVTVERTKKYIAWRFLKHPFFNYSMLVARRHGLLLGYIIFRFEEDQGFRICRIIDLISFEEAEFPLLQKFLEVAVDASSHAADFMFSGDFYKKSLLEACFFDVLGTGLEAFPILFSPISKKKNFINLATDMSISLKDCFFTKADGDQDRPNPN